MNFSFIVFAYFGLFILGMIDNSRGPIYPDLLNMFGIPKSQGALIFSLCSFSSFIVAVFNPVWLRKFGALNSARISLLLDFISLALMGTATSDASGFVQFLIASVILGLSLGIKGIVLNLIIKNHTQKSERRKYFSGLHAMYGIASLLSPLIIGWCFKANFDWQNLYLIFCIMPLATLVLSIKLKSTPYTTKTLKESRIKKRVIVYIGSMFATYVCCEILISSRLVIYLTEHYGLHKEVGSYFLSAFFLFLLIGRVLFVFVKLDLSSYKILQRSLVLTFLVLVVGLIFYPPILFLSGLTMSIFFPSAMDWISHLYPVQSDVLLARVMTIVGGFLVIVHWFFGVMSEVIGLQNSMWIAPSLLILSFILLIKGSKSANENQGLPSI